MTMPRVTRELLMFLASSSRVPEEEGVGGVGGVGLGVGGDSRVRIKQRKERGM